jgi:acyl-CoA hydrolase
VGPLTRAPLAAKGVDESRCEMTEIVLPSDANPLGTIFGGRVMQWIDICGSIVAQRHCRKVVVTASTDALAFLGPIRVGEVASLKGQINAAFHRSMEIGVEVYAEEPLSGARRLTTEALLTFTALDGGGRPTEVPPLSTQTDEERERETAAQARRQERLKRKQAREAEKHS